MTKKQEKKMKKKMMKREALAAQMERVSKERGFAMDELGRLEANKIRLKKRIAELDKESAKLEKKYFGGSEGEDCVRTYTKCGSF